VNGEIDTPSFDHFVQDMKNVAKKHLIHHKNEKDN
jgi:hypothetical protein